MSTPPGKIAIFGAGSIGCYLGGQLAGAGAPVTLIGRERYQTMLAEHGLTLTHYARPPIQLASDQIDFVTDPSGVRNADVVLVTVKSQDTQEAGRVLREAVNSRALVISFQNGVGNAQVLRDCMPDVTVLGAMVPFNVTSTGPGTFHCGTEGNLCIEFIQSKRLEALQSLFEKSGQDCSLSRDIAAVQWGKLLVNLNNALNALTGSTLYSGLVQRDYRRALALMIEEALFVVHAAGIRPEKFGKASPEKMLRILRLPNLLYRLIMNSVVKIDTSARSSMLDDLETGRASEIDYLQGEIVALAKKTGQSAPINERVLHEVQRAFERGDSPRMKGTEILAMLEESIAPGRRQGC